MKQNHSGGELIIDQEKLKGAAFELRALNNKLRQKILKFIHDHGKINVTDIYKKLRLEQSVTSQHLAVLRKGNYVVAEREGRTIYYSVNYQRLKYVDKQVKILLNRLPED